MNAGRNESGSASSSRCDRHGQPLEALGMGSRSLAKATPSQIAENLDECSISGLVRERLGPDVDLRKRRSQVGRERGQRLVGDVPAVRSGAHELAQDLPDVATDVDAVPVVRHRPGHQPPQLLAFGQVTADRRSCHLPGTPGLILHAEPCGDLPRHRPHHTRPRYRREPGG